MTARADKHALRPRGGMAMVIERRRHMTPHVPACRRARYGDAPRNADTRKAPRTIHTRGAVLR